MQWELEIEDGTNRSRLVNDIVTDSTGGFVLILVGVEGIGKTYLLNSLADQLTARNKQFAHIDSSAQDPLSKIQESTTENILLVDDLDHLSGECLEALMARQLAGTVIIGSATETQEKQVSRPFDVILQNEISSIDLRYLRVPPMTDSEVREMIYQISSRPLDSVLVEAIRKLAWGRPGWVVEYVQLAINGMLEALPAPMLSPLPLDQRALPSITWAETVAMDLSPGAVAAAVVISRLEPRTPHGLIDLIGAEFTNELISTGVALPTPNSAGSYMVPELYAAAMRPVVDTALLQQLSQAVTERLMVQEHLGVPLSEVESLFCTEIFSSEFSSSNATQERTALVRKVAGSFIDFGVSGRAREMLLRVGNSPGGLSMLERARFIAAIEGPVAGFRFLSKQSPELPAAGDTTSAVFNQAVAWSWLSAVLESKSLNMKTHRNSMVIAGEEFNVALLPGLRWNDNDPLGEDLPALLELAKNHPRPDIAISAELLIDIELLTQGRLFEPGKELSRIERLANITLFMPPELRDLASSLLVAKGLLTVQSGAYVRGGKTLIEIASHLPASARHEAWIRHLVEFAAALAGGRKDIATNEWNLFEQRLPYFIPSRLRAFIADISADLRGQLPSSPHRQAVPQQILRYMSGNFDDLDPARLSAPEASIITGAIVEKPLLKLARSHTEAIRTKNPVALMQIAEKLCVLELWAPAKHALDMARQIFLRRGSTRNVIACDQLLNALNHSAKHHLSWFDIYALPESPTYGLTPKELEIAQLVGKNLTNKAIATRLKCSVRTVETHVAKIRAKLGASTRKEISLRIQQTQYLRGGEEWERSVASTSGGGE